MGLFLPLFLLLHIFKTSACIFRYIIQFILRSVFTCVITARQNKEHSSHPRRFSQAFFPPTVLFSGRGPNPVGISMHSCVWLLAHKVILRFHLLVACVSNLVPLLPTIIHCRYTTVGVSFHWMMGIWISYTFEPL